MRNLLARVRPSVLTSALVLTLSVAGIATANRAIRDNSVNTRDIKDNQVNTRDLRNNSITTRDIRNNQVNTRDLRDGAIRGVDVHNGSLDLSDLNQATAALTGTATLLDPRRHDQDSNGDGAVENPGGSVAGHACCVSWTQGPVAVTEVAASASNPLPNNGSGRFWRSVVLDPGAYVIQTTARAEKIDAGAEGVATRLFLGGAAAIDGGGYGYTEASASPLSTGSSQSTAIEVGAGTPAQRQLVQRVAALGGAAKFSDNLLIWKVSPR